MPLENPIIDGRRYQDLLNEALARIPVHTPEWTNFGPSDPGRSVVELFCFLTENLLFRANQIPERNRRKFLQLLGVPLHPGSAARGLVVLDNRSGPSQVLTLNADLELRAGNVPFQTEQALDVLPIEGRVYYKRRLRDQSQQVEDHYRLLYASYRGNAPPENFAIDLYETAPLQQQEPLGIDLAEDAIDGSLWIALLARPRETPEDARRAIAGKTLSLGIVPVLKDASARLSPIGDADPEGESLLRYELPALPTGGNLPADPKLRVAQYRAVDARPFADVLTAPGVVELTLPGHADLGLWQNLDPLEAGVNDFPPALEDPNLESRLVTWLRVRATGGTQIRLLWVGINAVTVEQRTRVSNEVLQPGTGLPDQVRQLALKPVLPGSARLRVTHNGVTTNWQAIDDLFAAGSEVQTVDRRAPPGVLPPVPYTPDVFVVNHEAGTIQFGDGMRGRRPAEGDRLLATYDYSVGGAGNLEKGSINGGPALPAGFMAFNPVRTWGGANPESAVEGERQVSRYLQHRERLVTTEDFQTIARRAPGVQIGRLEVLPAFHPDLSPNEPGDAPGVVTLMVIPSHDRDHPDAPQPDRLFLNAICKYLDPRRLVTTELVLRGPQYVPIYLSVGIDLKAGHAAAAVREAVKRRLLEFLAPIAATAGDADLGSDNWREQGWPLRKTVLDRELMAEASRVEGVLLVSDLLMARGSFAATDQISIVGLQLPQVAGISVQIGAVQPLDALRGRAAAPAPQNRIPVPFVPEQC